MVVLSAELPMLLPKLVALREGFHRYAVPMISDGAEVERPLFEVLSEYDDDIRAAQRIEACTGGTGGVGCPALGARQRD